VPTPTPVVAPKAHELANVLDSLARAQSEKGVVYRGRPPAEQVPALMRELRAQAEADQSPQSQRVLELLPQIDAAMAKQDALELNRLAVQLRGI
jgi:hypothetical protein